MPRRWVGSRQGAKGRVILPERMFDSWFPRPHSSTGKGARPLHDLIEDLQRILLREHGRPVGCAAVHAWTIQALVFALASVADSAEATKPRSFLDLAARSSDWGSRIFRDDELWPVGEGSLGAVMHLLRDLDGSDLVEAISVALDHGRTLDWIDDGNGLKLSRDLTTAKVQGVFYTPTAIADYLAAKVVDGSAGSGCPRVCDPAVGSGRFLVAAARRLLLTYPKAVVQASLYGVDTDPVAVEVAALMLDALLGDWNPGERPASLHCRLVCGDSFGGPLMTGQGVGCKYDVEFESQPSRADARALNALTSGAGRALLRPVLRPPPGHRADQAPD
jgi:N-6 DNA Methylase